MHRFYGQQTSQSASLPFTSAPATPSSPTVIVPTPFSIASQVVDEKAAAWLVGLRHWDGQPLFDMDHLPFLYEILSIAQTQPSNLNRLPELIKPEYKLSRSDLVFELGQFDSAKKHYQEELDKARGMDKALAGIFECPRCKAKNTSTRFVQTSSGDEATRVINYCFDCQRVF